MSEGSTTKIVLLNQGTVNYLALMERKDIRRNKAGDVRVRQSI